MSTCSTVYICDECLQTYATQGDATACERRDRESKHGEDFHNEMQEMLTTAYFAYSESGDIGNEVIRKVQRIFEEANAAMKNERSGQ